MFSRWSGTSMAWLWEICPFFPLCSVCCVLFVFVLVAPSSFAHGPPVTGFYFTGSDTDSTFNLGIPPQPFNASNITILGQASGFTAGGLELCMTQAIPLNGTQNTEAAGRALYYLPIRLQDAERNSVLSFSTMFSFWIQTSVTIYTPGEGLAFIIAPDNYSTGATGRYLGWLNETTDNDLSGHNFAVEFDIHQDSQFSDIDDNHVGINLNSLNSMYSVHSSTKLTDQFDVSGGSRSTRYVWIEYDEFTRLLNVTVNSDTVKLPEPLISKQVNLSEIFNDFMYVGFTASTGSGTMAQHTVYDWSFNTSGKAVNVFVSKVGSDASSSNRIMIPVAVSVPVVFSVLVMILVVTGLYFYYYRKYKMARRFQVTELDNLEYGPHKFCYKDLSEATRKFNANEELGRGGFGSVYKGVVADGRVVAVKRICKKSKQGAREFIAEVKIIGRMRHRNLVPLLGWCHEKSKGELLLVYEYMPNGSLDNKIFRKDGEEAILSWKQRVNILSGVATALQYLHEEYLQRVVHRDVKASNVMLDANFNARLGDFGLARLYDHSQEPNVTKVFAGTFGYVAPEYFQDLKATEKTDVYSFGALTLEIATGRSVTEPPTGKTLVDWVWMLFSLGQITSAADSSLGEDYDKEEMELVLHLGLLCSHPDPDQRPNMRQSLSYLKREAQFSTSMLPSDKPFPMFAFNLSRDAINEILLGRNSATQSKDNGGDSVVDIDDGAEYPNHSGL